MTKRERTRQRILAAALELFDRHGYDRTTTAQIASAAGVSEMTLFRHFASKDRLLLDDPYDPVIAAAVADQPADRPALDRVIAGVRAAWRSVPEPAEQEVRRRMRIAAQSPGLAAAIRGNTRVTEEAIAAALAGTGVDPLTARIAAAATLAALMEALTAWAIGPGETPLDDVIRLALDVLDGAESR
ncbi:TetR/AcrR family transcriptional regulator [Microbacterium sp. NEAU-LLC]|uniref:TetR/AcrR family transcriptional regulator n=1 Tax=Microbacterium helvum TaxID=2773713 RepID=A0ABR8NK02_9MICO|nr:TetR/AcrR family transcriptional regulator [Microbacterium helvum]